MQIGQHGPTIAVTRHLQLLVRNVATEEGVAVARLAEGRRRGIGRRGHCRRGALRIAVVLTTRHDLVEHGVELRRADVVALVRGQFTHVPGTTFEPRPLGHKACLLIGEDCVLGAGLTVLLAEGSVVKPRVLTACLGSDGPDRVAVEQAGVRLPRILLALGAEARPLDTVTEGVVDCSEQIVGENRLCRAGR